MTLEVVLLGLFVLLIVGLGLKNGLSLRLNIVLSGLLLGVGGGSYLLLGNMAGEQEKALIEQIDTLSIPNKEDRQDFDHVLVDMAALELSLKQFPYAWAKLGDAYAQRGLHSHAVQAYKKAAIIQPDEIEWRYKQAVHLNLMNQGHLSPYGIQLVSQLLKEMPNHKGALGLMALHYFVQKEHGKARVLWDKLLTHPEISDGEAKAIRVLVKQSNAYQKRQISVRLHLPKEAQHLPQDTPVFVYVKERQNAGPPIAARKLLLSEVDQDITLNDSHSLRPNVLLSQAKDVLIGATLSLSGQAIAQSNDIQAISRPLNLEEGPVRIELEF